MLHVAPGQPALMRLQRAASEANLQLYTRVLSGCSGFYGKLRFVAGVVGGTHRDVFEITAPELSPIGDAGVGSIGQPQVVTLALPDPGKDVLLAIFGDQHFGFSCVKIGALIDDVTLL